MVDLVSIVIAVISLAGTLAAAGLTAWFAYFTEERRRQSEAEKLFRKYRDPMLEAANDLQSRLYNLVKPERKGILSWMFRDERRADNLVQYTCFLVGRYLAWTHILRRQAQFLPMPANSTGRKLRDTLFKIEGTMRTTAKEGSLFRPFLLWQGPQMAVAEVMTVKEDGELYSMGFAAFRQKWKADAEFKEWFESLVEGLKKIAEVEARGPSELIPDHRLRRLQHLLLDLMHLLDPQGLEVDLHRLQRCRRADICDCLACEKESRRTAESA